jgi:hypothetical protein
MLSYSQLTSGVYNIVKQTSVVEGQEMFETDKMLGTSFFMVDLENSTISFTASDYIVAVYNISETLESNGSTLYICKERKTGHSFKLMFKPHSSLKDAGELMIPQSSDWYDFFSILKIEQ